MRDKEFYINAIKMDLMRIVYAAGDIGKEFPVTGVIEFIEHTESLFEHFEATEYETERLSELRELRDSMELHRDDPHKRLRWAEDVLTIRARL